MFAYSWPDLFFSIVTYMQQESVKNPIVSPRAVQGWKFIWKLSYSEKGLDAPYLCLKLPGTEGQTHKKED